MSPVSVKRETIPIPMSAIGELYPVKKGAIESDSPMMSIPDRVRNERIFPLILATICSSSAYRVSSRTVIV